MMDMDHTASFLEEILHHASAGTSAEPNSTPHDMRMTRKGAWMLMFHGSASVNAQQETGPRGGDKVFSTSWFMPMAQRQLGIGTFTARAMFSLEPATITGERYPELFQVGETAYGKPIVDGQHPHNLFMEIAALYDVKAGKNGLFSIYAAPVGDPALGPVAYPHRASAMEDPIAPLGHHLEDSTHIAWDVLTGGVAFGPVRVEASGFHGREPDENRWHIEVGAVDSWSARATAALSKDWTAQYSVGHLTSPEQLHPDEDVLRQTASIAMHHAWGEAAQDPKDGTTLDALVLWGRNHTIGSDVNWNGYLFEATSHIHDRHSIWTRIENVDRTSDLLGTEAPPEEYVIGRVQAYTGGYAHRLYADRYGSAEIGAQVTLYNTPDTLRALYGDHPVGVAAVLNVHLGK